MTMFGEAGTGPRVPGTVTSFLKIFGFVMLCGIVGPIFLVAYFLIDEPGTGWMLWTGLGVTLLDVVIALFIARLSIGGQQRTARLRTTGRMAIAEIRGVEQTNVQINDQPLMKLDLHIHGDGISSFETQKRTVVPIFQQPMLHRRVLAVLVDPATNEFEIDWQATALLTGSVPARFTSSEDGRTYDMTGRTEPLIRILEILRQHDVSTSGSIDLRSNPHARQAVMEIVRAYAGRDGRWIAESSPAGGSVAATDLLSTDSRRPVGERLGDLEGLRSTGQITHAEYAAARQRILDSI
ncbi:SHOCT domain-containing protein [Gordonia sp. ABSL11-1]|uniref:SHOCT domain-containing protein n=1 Tax=Gordonia sp. ABSL11-1 TaxID=3053924 RepID=UPI0025724E32|nr:SHOCT domain-containing protein [Gordonia sp. ABSL11-1]MDL9944834.1 SHOCT domain-containing protein [Gordonia sp. ABSL11-1]